MDERPLCGQESFVVREKRVARRQELGEHPVRVERDVAHERTVHERREQLGLIELVNDLAAQVLDEVGVPVAQESLRLPVQPPRSIIESVGLPTEVADLVLATRTARTWFVAA